MESALPQSVQVLFASGARDAFLEVYRFFAPGVRRWVARFFKSPFEQEEAVQEVWLTVHRMARAYDVNRELQPWLRVVAANRCRELLRAKGRRPDASVPLDDVGDARWLEEPVPVDAAWTAKVREQVARFRASLDGDEARALDGLLIEEQTHEELAASLKISVRRSKYLKKKLLERAVADPALRSLADEVMR